MSFLGWIILVVICVAVSLPLQHGGMTVPQMKWPSCEPGSVVGALSLMAGSLQSPIFTKSAASTCKPCAWTSAVMERPH